MNADIFSSSATDTNFSAFWSNVSDATSTSPRGCWWQLISGYWSQDLFMWDFKFEDKEHLLAHELSVHGKPRGKLAPPKLQLPKGFKHMRLRQEFSGNRGRGNT